MHRLFPLFFLFFIVIGALQAASVVIENENATGVILHPSQTDVYYYVNSTIYSVSNIMIESHYITISDVPIEVVATCETYVYLNSFEPEHIAMENTTIANFTISMGQSDADVRVYLGNLFGAPLIVYRDGEPFYVSTASMFNTFEGDVITINSSDCFYFADGVHVAKALEMSAVNISELTQGSVVVSGTVVEVAYNGSYTIIVVSDGTGSVEAVFPYQLPLESGEEVVVCGEYEGGVIRAAEIWLDMPSSFNVHTYEVRTPAYGLVAAVVQPEFPLFCLLLVIVLLFVFLLFIILKRRGDE